MPKSTKKRKTREAWGRIRKLPSGRFQASYQGPDLAVHKASSTFETLTDARGWLQTERALIDGGEWVAPGIRRQLRPVAPTFGEYADQWVAGRDLKPRTRRDYRGYLRNHFTALRPLPIDTITPDLVRSWYATLAPGLPTARANAYGLLRTIMQSAAEEELIKTNPASIRGASSKKRRHKIEVATGAELDALAAALPDRYGGACFVYLGAWCGLRWGELTELRRGDLEITPGPLYGGRLTVSRGVTRVDGEYVVGDPKSDAGIRTVSIPPHIVPVIIKHLRMIGPGDNQLLFPSVTNRTKHLSGAGAFHKAWSAATTAAGISGFRVHDLRHHGATRAAIAGATTAELMRRIGHSTPNMAARYQHALDDRDSEIARKLSEMVVR